MGKPFLDEFDRLQKNNEELRVFVADLKAENKQLSDELTRQKVKCSYLHRGIKRIVEMIEAKG